ncbi:transposase [Streptomyces adustus]
MAVSWVANVMISVDAADSASVEALSEWLRTDAPRRAQPEVHGVGFLKLLTSPETNQWGGWKHPECEVWAGALNHADLDALKQRVFEMPWREPNLALVLDDLGRQGVRRSYRSRSRQPLGAVAPLLPPPPERRRRHPGRLRVPDQTALAGVMYVLRTGVAWRDVPAKTPDPSRTGLPAPDTAGGEGGVVRQGC